MNEKLDWTKMPPLPKKEEIHATLDGFLDGMKPFDHAAAMAIISISLWETASDKKDPITRDFLLTVIRRLQFESVTIMLERMAKLKLENPKIPMEMIVLITGETYDAQFNKYSEKLKKLTNALKLRSGSDAPQSSGSNPADKDH